MSKKTKASMDDYEPTTEIGKKAKEQLIRLLNRPFPNRLSRYCCVYTDEQIVELCRQTKYIEQMKNQHQEIKYEIKIQSEKADA